MKSYGIVTIVLLSLVVFLLGFNYKNLSEPNAFYQVYLDDEVIGVIKSKKELESFIDAEGEHIKKQYGVNKVYSPDGLEIKKITTYDKKLDTVRKVYQTIKEKKPFTIKGQQITIKQEILVSDEDEKKETEQKVKKYYVLNEEIFREAIESAIETFVGKEKYEAYRNEEQQEIETTGTFINDIYIDGDKTIKAMNIPITEDIYTNATDLAHDLIFGKNGTTKKYVVQLGDTIEKIAFNNEISVGEFLISNKEFTSEKNLLYPNQEVVIGVTDPQISVVMDVFSVQDMESAYTTETRYDEQMMLGEKVLTQKGEKGLERVSQNMQYTNGTITYVEPKGKETLKNMIPEIITEGTHYVPHIGSLTSWGWPTEPGWTITSYYAWRINPINGARELHDAIDIAGTGYGSKIYAANNGTIVESSYTNINGNYVIINHNNGYFTYYGHMSRRAVNVGDVVPRGYIIGYVGDTGWATGPHVHYAIWKGYPYRGGKSMNPLNFY